MPAPYLAPSSTGSHWMVSLVTLLGNSNVGPPKLAIMGNIFKCYYWYRENTEPLKGHRREREKKHLRCAPETVFTAHYLTYHSSLQLPGSLTKMMVQDGYPPVSTAVFCSQIVCFSKNMTSQSIIFYSKHLNICRSWIKSFHILYYGPVAPRTNSIHGQQTRIGTSLLLLKWK